MVETAISEKIDHEALGGARMHCEESGCGDVLAASDEDAIAAARRYLGYMPQSHRDRVADAPPRDPNPERAIDDIVPYDQRKSFDMHEVIRALVDAGSWFEMKTLFAREIITGFARLAGRAGGIVANQPRGEGGGGS